MSSKLREALNQLLGLIDNNILVFSDELDSGEVSNAQYQIDKADEAFVEPPRNCDIGTPEEQEERHDEYCTSAISTCRGVSTRDCVRCFARWAQMPYKEVK